MQVAVAAALDISTIRQQHHRLQLGTCIHSKVWKRQRFYLGAATPATATAAACRA